MARVTKKSAAPATPRATRSSVRSGSASLSTTPLVAPRRGRSRSITPSSETAGTQEPLIDNLPTLPEEEERLPTPLPIEVAPIVDASPFITPARPTLASPSPSPEVIAITSRSPSTSPDAATIASASPSASPSTSVSASASASASASPVAPAFSFASTSASISISPVAPAIAAPSPLREPAIINTAADLQQLLYSPRILRDLTASDRTSALMLEMRKEILRLRKVEAEYLASQQQQQQQQQSPARPEPSPEMPRSTYNRRNIRFHMSIAKPAAEAQAAMDAAAAIQAQIEAEAKAKAAATQAASQPQPESVASHASPSPADKSSEKRRKTKTPQKTPQKSASPVDSPTASPAWGIGSLFGSVRSIFGNRTGMSPVKQQQTPSRASHASHASQGTQDTRATPVVQPKSPTSPSPAAPAPTPVDETRQTPAKTRRRGVLPGSVRTPRRRDSPRQKPKEPNADRRAQQMEQAAERKRIQEQAEKLEQERVRAKQDLKRREEEDAARQQAGNKRKRVRVDDLQYIPSHRPGEKSGSFGLLDEFFDQNSDEDEDDYVEMDVEDIQLLASPARPAKKARLDENVFQPKSPAVQPPASPASAPSTPGPNYSQITQQAIEKQRLQFSQHKPKQPSRLRQVERLSTGSTASNGVSPSPLQPSSASTLNAPKRPSPGSSASKSPSKRNAAPVATPSSPASISPMDATPYITSAPPTAMFAVTAHSSPALPPQSPLPHAHTRLSNINEATEPESPLQESPTPITSLPPLELEWPATTPMGPAWLWEKLDRLYPETDETRAQALKDFREGAADRLRREQLGLVSTEIPESIPFTLYGPPHFYED